MNDPRRSKVPWYLWQWRVGLLLPMLLFALLAVNALTTVGDEPALSVVLGAIFLGLAILFARLAWRDRHPLHSKARRTVGEKK